MNFTLRYIDDVLSNFANPIPFIHPPPPPKELEIKEATTTATSASSYNIYLEFDTNVQLSNRVRLNDKRDNSNFAIINVQRLYSNIPTALSYGVYNHTSSATLKLVVYIHTFFKRHHILRTKLLNQGILKKIVLSKSFSEYYNTLFKSILSIAYR